jgi:hypothetical protein
MAEQVANANKLSVLGGTRQTDLDNLKANEQKILDIQAKALDLAVQKIAVDAQSLNFRQLQQQGLEEQRAASLLEASLLQASISGSETKAALAQAQFATTKAAIDLKRVELGFERDESELLDLIEKSKKEH